MKDSLLLGYIINTYTAYTVVLEHVGLRANTVGPDQAQSSIL